MFWTTLFKTQKRDKRLHLFAHEVSLLSIKVDHKITVAIRINKFCLKYTFMSYQIITAKHLSYISRSLSRYRTTLSQ